MKNMLLKKIKDDAVLSKYIREKCEENNICVEVDARVSREDYVILDVDKYYQSLNQIVSRTPDCLFVQRCQGGGYALTIAELKKYNEAGRFENEDIGKFRTCFEDFMQVRFSDFFDRDFKRIQLFFVSRVDVFGSENVDKSRMMRLLLNARFDFRGKKYLIMPRKPIPAIKPCY
jgi:hypothetical protein